MIVLTKSLAYLAVRNDRNIRQFIDLVRKISGKWTSWDPPIPVTVIVLFFLSVAISVKTLSLRLGLMGHLTKMVNSTSMAISIATSSRDILMITA